MFLDGTQLCAFLVYPSPQRVYEFSYIRRYEFIVVLSVAWNGTFRPDSLLRSLHLAVGPIQTAYEVDYLCY